jgi:hypothetical protein
VNFHLAPYPSAKKGWGFRIASALQAPVFVSSSAPVESKALAKDGSMATENDIVLIYFEGSPLTYARIEAIEPDIKRDWYHVKLLLLQVPLQVVTWILRDVYINGETFTMNGKQMRLEKIECPEDDSVWAEEHEEENTQQKSSSKDIVGGKVISLSKLKKK